MTSKNGYKNNTTNGQQVSRPVCRTGRHSLPILLSFLFFAEAYFLKIILWQPHTQAYLIFQKYKHLLRKQKNLNFSNTKFYFLYLDNIFKQHE